NVPCTATANTPTIAIYPAPPVCTNADFTIALNAKAEASQFLAKDNAATGSHTIAMASQPVLGAQIQFTKIVTVGPPIVIKPTAALPSTLTIKMDSVVNFTFTVSNPASMPVQVNYNSGQHNDFYVTDLTTGEVVWRESASRLYLQVTGTQTIP